MRRCEVRKRMNLSMKLTAFEFANFVLIVVVIHIQWLYNKRN